MQLVSVASVGFYGDGNCITARVCVHAIGLKFRHTHALSWLHVDALRVPSKHIILIKNFWIHVHVHAHVHVHVGGCLLLCMHVVVVQISCGQLSRDKLSTCVYHSRAV